MFQISRDTILTPQIVSRFLQKDAANNARKQKLYNYYKGNSVIKRRAMADSSKPNNKLNNPFASYITDLTIGYFVGKPIQYSSAEEGLIDELRAIYIYNDEEAENAELAKNCSIFGEAYEVMYLDESSQIHFDVLSSIGAIPIYDDSVRGKLMYFIRYYDFYDIIQERTIIKLEVYTSEEIWYGTADGWSVKITEKKPHNWYDVPIIVYQNNPEGIGDFENVISLIDAYDIMESDTINDMEYFNDAYLALYGLEGTEPEDIASMKEQRVLLMPNDSEAEWLIKSMNDTYIENEKARLEKDIHKFSYVPPMTDENFAANASGVAMKYKLMGLENVTAKKERAFKKGLQRRIRLITNIISLYGASYDWRSISILFTRNIPSNVVEMADVVSKIGSLYSEETQMKMIPIDVNYEEEQKKKEQERENGYSIDFNTGTSDE